MSENGYELIRSGRFDPSGGLPEEWANQLKAIEDSLGIDHDPTKLVEWLAGLSCNTCIHNTNIHKCTGPVVRAEITDGETLEFIPLCPPMLDLS